LYKWIGKLEEAAER